MYYSGLNPTVEISVESYIHVCVRGGLVDGDQYLLANHFTIMFKLKFPRLLW